MFFIAVYVSSSGIFEHINMVCNRCGTRIYAWDKIICVNMLIWFVASLAMDKSSCVFAVALQISGFARINVSIARMHFSTWPAYIFSWTFNVF